MPFRDAHEAVARAVRHAEAKRVDLAALPLAELQTFATSIAKDVFDVLTLDGSVASRVMPEAPPRDRCARRLRRRAPHLPPAIKVDDGIAQGGIHRVEA
jgi:argininosuccinate lyase